MVMASPARARRIEIRVSEEEHLVETAAAETMGVSLSEFYRQAARARAEEILAERSSVVLDAASAARFLDALDDPTRFEPGLSWLRDGPSVVSS